MIRCEKMKIIQIEDKDIIAKFIDESIINSEYQFTTLFAWANKYKFRFELHNGFLLIFGNQSNGDLQCYCPLGSGDLEECLSYIKTVFKNHNTALNFRPLSEMMKCRLVSALISEYEVGTNEAYYDYLFAYDDLAYMKGAKYRKKRKMINHFQSKYAYEFKIITQSDVNLCILALKRIAIENGNFDSDEWEANKRLFLNFSDLGLKGVIILIDNIIQGIAVGETCKNMIMLHIRRCNKRFTGMAPTILQLLLKTHFSKDRNKIINMQDDMGILGIRQSKLSYRPVRLLTKYYIKEKDNEQ